MVRVLILASLLLISQISSAYVFLPDDRVPLVGQKKRAYQNRVGVVYGPNAVEGTGFVYRAPRIVITAAHVLFRNGVLKSSISSVFFTVGENLHYTDLSTPFRIKDYRSGTQYPDNEPDKDWVVLLLESPVQNITPIMPQTAPVKANFSLNLLGFHGDKGDGLILTDSSCHEIIMPVKDAPEGTMFRHKCDSYGRASGSPLLSGQRLVGIHTGAVSFTKNSNGKPLKRGDGSDGSYNNAIYINNEIEDAVQKLLESR